MNTPIATQLEELVSYMASKISVPTIGIGGGYAPIGTINFFDATTAPQDWLACDGSVHNIADYPQLAEWYATQHGVANFYGGNGTTTFAVPNLQGEFLRGTGTNSHSGQGSGASVGTHQDGTIFAGSLSDTTALYNRGFGSSGLCNSVTNADSNVKRNIVQSASSASGEAISNIDCPTFRPTNTSFLICVKAVVAGEVYSTEEREVGTWIDGKPLYQKTIVDTMPDTTDRTKASKTILSDASIKMFVDLRGFLLYSVGISMPFPIVSGGASDSYPEISGRIHTSNSPSNSVSIQNWSSSNSGKTAYITIRYTKTTD